MGIKIILNLFKTHLSCEAKNGIHSIECLVEDMKFKYTCPWCRIED